MEAQKIVPTAWYTTAPAGTFDPDTFVGPDYKVVGERKKLPKDWTPAKLRGICPVQKDESHIKGDEWRRRLIGKNLLGVEAFCLCWNNLHLIPEELNGLGILFEGDVLQGQDGRLYCLALDCGVDLSWSLQMANAANYDEWVSAVFEG